MTTTKSILKYCFYPFFLLNDYIQRNWIFNLNQIKENYPTNEWYRRNIERNFDIVNIGSSSGKYAFDYSNAGIKAFNWAEQPQSLSYSFSLLKMYFSILKKHGIVVISLSPFSSLNVDGKWGVTANDKYYYILDKTLIPNYKEVSNRINFSLYTHPVHSIKKILINFKKNKFGVCEDFEINANHYLENWKKQFSLDDLDATLSAENYKGRAYRVSLLSEMIDFCLKRDLQPILVIPPIHPALAMKFTEKFKEDYIYSFINEANKAEIPFYDYMNSSIFQKDDYFTDSFLLNKAGAQKFTRLLLSEIL